MTYCQTCYHKLDRELELGDVCPFCETEQGVDDLVTLTEDGASPTEIADKFYELYHRWDTQVYEESEGIYMEIDDGY